MSHLVLARLMFAPTAETFPMAVDRGEVKLQAIKLILAGQAYRRTHGTFPKELDLLVPEYLDELPIDPYDGKPMKYRNTGDGPPIVYSVLKNQIDDGGKEYNYETRVGRDPLDYGLRMLTE